VDNYRVGEEQKEADHKYCCEKGPEGLLVNSALKGQSQIERYIRLDVGLRTTPTVAANMGSSLTNFGCNYPSWNHQLKITGT